METVLGLPWEIDGIVKINGAKVSAGIYRTVPIDAIPDESDEICRAEYPYAPLIVRAVNAHATLVAALMNARSIVRAFTGDLLAVPKSQSDAGYVDSVAWTVQQEIETALHLAKHGSSQVEAG